MNHSVLVNRPLGITEVQKQEPVVCCGEPAPLLAATADLSALLPLSKGDCQKSKSKKNKTSKSKTKIDPKTDAVKSSKKKTRSPAFPTKKKDLVTLVALLNKASSSSSSTTEQNKPPASATAAAVPSSVSIGIGSSNSSGDSTSEDYAKLLLTRVNTLERHAKESTKLLEKQKKKTKRHKKKTRHLKDIQRQNLDLTTQLIHTEEHVQVVTYENQEYALRFKSLEQALIMQETELEDAVHLNRQYHAAQYNDNEWCDEQQETALITNAENDKDDLNICKLELQQIKSERDTAVVKATELSVQLAEIRAMADSYRDQLAGSTLLIAQLREQNQHHQQQQSSKRSGLFWSSSKKQVEPTTASTVSKSAGGGGGSSEPTVDSASLSCNSSSHSISSVTYDYYYDDGVVLEDRGGGELPCVNLTV